MLCVAARHDRTMHMPCHAGQDAWSTGVDMPLTSAYLSIHQHHNLPNRNPRMSWATVRASPRTLVRTPPSCLTECRRGCWHGKRLGTDAEGETPPCGCFRAGAERTARARHLREMRGLE